MARRYKRRPYQNRRGRRRRRSQASYRHGLIEAIGASLPGQFFSRWASAAAKWSPLRLFWMAILMAWSAEQTLQARFEETREVVRSLFPKWRLGKSYTGWYEAQLKWLTPLQPALSKRLRQQLQRTAGQHWQQPGNAGRRNGLKQNKPPRSGRRCMAPMAPHIKTSSTQVPDAHPHCT